MTDRPERIREGYDPVVQPPNERGYDPEPAAPKPGRDPKPKPPEPKKSQTGNSTKRR